MSVVGHGTDVDAVARMRLVPSSDVDEAPLVESRRALIVDGQRMFGEAIAASMRDSGFEIVGHALEAEEAVPLARRLMPDMVVMRLSDLGHDSIEAGKAILSDRPQTKIVVLTSSHDPFLVRHAIDVGFHGYLTTGAGVDELIESLRAVARGQMVIPRVTSSAASGTLDGPLLALSSLTVREREILVALTRGYSTREIGRTMYISPNTVRTHVQALFVKLQVHSRLEAVAFAKRHGFLRDA